MLVRGETWIFHPGLEHSWVSSDSWFYRNCRIGSRNCQGKAPKALY